MTDTAEYWWDVKRNYPYTGPNYYHIPNFECGHRHLFVAKFVDEVNCHECKQALKNGFVHNLLSSEEHQKRIEQRKQDKLKNLKLKSIHHHPNNPICSCGFVMIKRKK
jgi:hypothetical protein